MPRLSARKYMLLLLLLLFAPFGCEQSSAPPANPAPPVADPQPETSTEFKGELLEFTAPWCGYCKKMAPIIAELKQQGYPIRTIDTDEHPELKSKFKINGWPTFVYLVDGKEKKRIRGATTKRRLLALWE